MAITTLYEGIEYRSRLEARWAAFFHRIGWQTTYEPFDGDGYIPDFLIHGNRPLLVEVKPAVTLTEYQAPIGKAVAGLLEHWTNGDILIVGVDPFPQFENSWGYNQMPPAGIIGDGMWQDGGWDFGVGNWMSCDHCLATGVFHDIGCYAGRPCGHWDGDHYLRAADSGHLRDSWAAACNDVKWRGRQVQPPTRTTPTRPLATWDRVMHPEFGEGLVISVTGIGEAAVLTIDFGLRHGSKQMLARHAPLNLIGNTA